MPVPPKPIQIKQHDVIFLDASDVSVSYFDEEVKGGITEDFTFQIHGWFLLSLDKVLLHYYLILLNSTILTSGTWPFTNITTKNKNIRSLAIGNGKNYIGAVKSVENINSLNFLAGINRQNSRVAAMDTRFEPF